MSRIIVIGCPGAGKSTFARKLRDKTNLPLFYLDQIWHKADKTHISRDEFDLKLNEIFNNNESWIIDGDYSRTLETRFEHCDMVFLFDLPVEECIDGVKSRIGKVREDMPWVEDEIDEEFRQQIVNFSKDELPAIYKLIEKHKDTKEIHIFYSRKESDEYIQTIK